MWSSDSNQDRLLSYVRNALVSNWKRALILFSVGFVMVVLWVRFSPIQYLPKTTYFAQASKSPRLDSAALTGAMPELERSVIIMTQKQLVQSFPIYESVKKEILDKLRQQDDAESSGPKSSTIFDKIFYGEKYLSGRDKWRDANYLAFKRQVFFEQDLASSTFTIGYSDSDPDRALAVTKVLGSSLMKLNDDIIDKKRRNLIENLESQIKVTNKLLIEAQQEVAKFEVENSFPSSLDMAATTYKDLITAKNAFLSAELDEQANRAGLAKVYAIQKQITEYVKSHLRLGSEIEVSKLMQELQVRMAALGGEDETVEKLKQKLDSALNSSIPFSNESTEKVIGELKKTQTTMETNLASILKRKEVAEKYYKELSTKMSEIPKLTAQVAELVFKKEQRKSLLSSLNQRYLAASVQESGSDMNQFVQTDEPMITDASVQSNKGKSLAYGSVLCIFAVLFICVGTPFIKGTIFTKYDLGKLNIPNHRCVGTIPYFPNLKLNNVIRTFVSSEVISRTSLAIKSVLFPQSNLQSQVMLFTSAADKGGKSISTLAISLSLRRSGLSVVAIDCDYRASHSNLIEYTTLSKEAPNEIHPWATMQDLLKACQTSAITEFKNTLNMVRPLPSDTEDKNAAQYLAHQLKTEIAELKKSFDVIILDGPPAFFTDSAVLGEHADALVICCPEGKTTRAEVEHIANEVASGRVKANFSVCTMITQAKLKENSHAQSQANIYQYRNRKDRLSA